MKSSTKIKFITTLIITLTFNVIYAQNSSVCFVEIPQNWKNTVRWEGNCYYGKADGLGILKEITGSNVNRIFFGKVKSGVLQVGVIENPNEGFEAGIFKNRKILSSEERQTYLNAFKIGAEAANLTSDNYRVLGNNEASKFYKNKAKLLNEQMD